MKEINWARKFSSRKFWLSVSTFVSMLIVANGGAQSTAKQITALIMSGGAVIAFILAEGFTDVVSAKNQAKQEE